MYDLRSRRLIQVDKPVIVIDKATSDKFNDMMEKEYMDDVDKAFMARLPKFPKAALERMRIASEAIIKSTASSKFYTWVNGATATSTSHTAWGHRRNGGGKSKITNGIIFKKMNSSEAVVERAAAKKMRQKANKEKDEIERVKYSENMKRVSVHIPEIEVSTVVVEEETEWHIFKRNELESVRSKLRLKTTDVVYIVDVLPVVKKLDDVTWTKVDTKKNKNDKSALDLAIALYQKPIDELSEKIAIAVKKKPMSKKVTSTLMCSSVAKNQKCPHPVGKCNFAHCAEELKPRSCVNTCCKFVKRIGDKFVNKGYKICSYIHEGETKVNLCHRIGVKADESKYTPLISNEKCPAYMTPISTRVMKPFSDTLAWAPIDY